MPYIANKDILMMSSGKSWKKGMMIGSEEIPVAVRKKMLEEGVIEQVGEKLAKKAAAAVKSTAKKVELPISEEKEVDVD